MTLSVGIVGLPNVGKSTLFNALLCRQQAYVANYPFATIEPNIGIVPVPDERLPKLAQVVHTSKQVPATVTFLDIAGLVKGASQGEGLGNKFLSHIREASVILHVVRAFVDPNVVQSGSGNAIEDYLTIETELQLADLATLEKQKQPRTSGDKGEMLRWKVIAKLKEALNEGKSARTVELNEEEEVVARELFLLTRKPEMWVLNSSESANQLSGLESKNKFITELQSRGVNVGEDDIVVICAKLEEELAGFEEKEKREYLKSAGIEKTGLETLILAAYKKLGLMSFLTAGEIEVRAWTVPVGTVAPAASGVIHTDFIKHFISAKVCNFEDFIALSGWKGAAEKGKVRSEGKGYVMQEGDVVEFMIGS